MVGGPLRWCFLGRVSYEQALKWQLTLVAQRQEGSIPDTLLFLEHDAVYTAGRRAQEDELLWDAEERTARGVALSRTDRGGKFTFHGPGQLVGYPIVDIKDRGLGVRAWVEKIEWALIDYLRTQKIESQIVCGRPGVWVGGQKIAALGLHVRRGISYHGFALNVFTDLSLYGGIVPCGIQDGAITSIAALTGAAPALDRVAEDMAWTLGNRLGAKGRREEAQVLLHGLESKGFPPL